MLSIQSHVVSGYVGNDSATFPLQVGNLIRIEMCPRSRSLCSVNDWTNASETDVHDVNNLFV